jgi:hypothetical protein
MAREVLLLGDATGTVGVREFSTVAGPAHLILEVVEDLLDCC